MNKIGLVLAATIAVGMFALPATMAYFTGQHVFVAGADVDCGKCHSDIDTEFYVTNENTNGPHSANMVCRDCHITEAMGGASAYQNPADKGGHASTAVECMDCHNNSAVAFPQAGEFGDHDITNATAAHRNFYLDALSNSDTTLKNGANEACVACHTHTAVTIDWLPGNNMSYNQSTGTFANTDLPGQTLNATV